MFQVSSFTTSDQSGTSSTGTSGNSCFLFSPFGESNQDNTASFLYQGTNEVLGKENPNYGNPPPFQTPESNSSSVGQHVDPLLSDTSTVPSLVQSNGQPTNPSSAISNYYPIISNLTTGSRNSSMIQTSAAVQSEPANYTNAPAVENSNVVPDFAPFYPINSPPALHAYTAPIVPNPNCIPPLIPMSPNIVYQYH